MVDKDDGDDDLEDGEEARPTGLLPSKGHVVVIFNS